MKNLIKIITIMAIVFMSLNISNVSAQVFNQLYESGGSSTVPDPNSNQQGTNDKGQVVYCDDNAIKKPLKFIGHIINIAKIIIPVVLIVFGSLDLFRSIISAKPDEIAKAIKSLVMRAIAAVIIFFIPLLIDLLFKLLDDWQAFKSDYKVCSTCLLNPKDCSTK